MACRTGSLGHHAAADSIELSVVRYDIPLCRQVLNLSERIQQSFLKLWFVAQEVVRGVSRNRIQKRDKPGRIISGLPRVLNSQLIGFCLKLFTRSIQHVLE